MTKLISSIKVVTQPNSRASGFSPQASQLLHTSGFRTYSDRQFYYGSFLKMHLKMYVAFVSNILFSGGPPGSHVGFHVMESSLVLCWCILLLDCQIMFVKACFISYRCEQITHWQGKPHTLGSCLGPPGSQRQGEQGEWGKRRWGPTEVPVEPAHHVQGPGLHIPKGTANDGGRRRGDSTPSSSV